MKSDFAGNNTKVLVDQNLGMINVYGNDIYYTVTGEAGLFYIEALTGTVKRPSDIVTDDILINQSGVYFINKSYDAGIFKISGDKVSKIADGFIQEYINTDGGILYNKRGFAEVYLAK